MEVIKIRLQSFLRWIQRSQDEMVSLISTYPYSSYRFFELAETYQQRFRDLIDHISMLAYSSGSIYRLNKISVEEAKLKNKTQIMFFLTDTNKKLEELKYRLLKVVHKKEPNELKQINMSLNKIYEEICQYGVEGQEKVPSFGLTKQLLKGYNNSPQVQQSSSSKDLSINHEKFRKDFKNLISRKRRERYFSPNSNLANNSHGASNKKQTTKITNIEKHFNKNNLKYKRSFNYLNMYEGSNQKLQQQYSLDVKLQSAFETPPQKKIERVNGDTTYPSTQKSQNSRQHTINEQFEDPLGKQLEKVTLHKIHEKQLDFLNLLQLENKIGDIKDQQDSQKNENNEGLESSSNDDSLEKMKQVPKNVCDQTAQFQGDVLQGLENGHEFSFSK